MQLSNELQYSVICFVKNSFSFFLFHRAYKEITEDDLKFPLVYGEGKRARMLATIGVTRGFGDHELKVHGTDIFIKPFLTPAPEVGALVCSLLDQTKTHM